MTDLNCGRCNTEIYIDDCDLPYEDEESVEVECSTCDAKLEIVAHVSIDHSVVCAHGNHRYIEPWWEKDHELSERGDKYGQCMDCEESDWVDPKLVKTKEQWLEEEKKCKK